MSLYSSTLRQRREIGLLEAAAWVGCGVLGLGVYKLVKRYVQWLFNPLNKKLPTFGLHSFLLGVFPEIRNEPFLQPHKRWIAEVPDAKLIHYTTIFGRSNLLVLDKDIIRQILTAPAGKQDHRFKKKLVSLQNIIGDGLVTLEGEDWMRHRRIVQPAFSPGIVRDALQDTVPGKVEELIRLWKMAGTREIDAYSHFSALTLDILGPVAFSHECRGLDSIRAWAYNSQRDQLPELDDPFQKAMTMAFKFDLVSTLLLVLDLLSWDLLRSKRRDARAFLDAEADKIVAVAMASSQEASTAKAKSILSALLEAHSTEEGKLTKKELRDEVKTCESERFSFFGWLFAFSHPASWFANLLYQSSLLVMKYVQTIDAKACSVVAFSHVNSESLHFADNQYLVLLGHVRLEQKPQSPRNALRECRETRPGIERREN